MTKTMSVRMIAAGALLASVGAAACSGTSRAAQARQTQIERGKYLVSIGGCNDCHTPLKMGPKGPEPDTARMLSGHPESFPIDAAVPPSSPQWLMSAAASGTAFSGPWGVSFAANLTPDQNTGLGIWTEDMFIKAVRMGKHMGTSRDILPPMPWPNVGGLTDEDVKAVYAFLRSIQPVRNRVPDPLPPASAQSTENRAGEAATGNRQ